MLRARCPVGETERIWIEENLDWLTGQFGNETLQRAALLPDDQRLPRPYRGEAEQVEQMIDTLFAHLGVDRAEITLEIEPPGLREHQLRASLGSLSHSWSGEAGHYRHGSDGRPVIRLTGELIADPVGLVAVLAHELGHHRLIGEGRIPRGRRDGEPLTDLLTVFFGVGHFNANAAYRFATNARGWQRTSLGYMNQPMFGYALARYALLKGEPDPAWYRLLDTNPRGYFREGRRYLRRAAL